MMPEPTDIQDLFPRFSPDYFPCFTDAEYQRRYDAIRKLMATRGLDGLIIYGESGYNEHNMANVYYLTNYSAPYPCYVLFPATGEPALLISAVNHLPHARRMSRLADTEGVSGSFSRERHSIFGARLVTKLKEMGLERARLGLVGARGFLSHEHVEALHTGLPHASFQEAPDIMLEVRRIKSQEEIAWIRKGAELTDLAVYALEEQAREGMAEYELAAIMASAYMREEGGWPKTTSIGSTSMREPELVFPRLKPANRILRKGDVILTELSIAYWQYSGQIQRCIAVGEAPTPIYQEVFDIASEVYHRIVDALGPGKTEADVIRAGSIMKERGVWTFDGLLHGWGLTVEPPNVEIPEVALLYWGAGAVTFEPGMTVVVQPDVVSNDKRHGVQVGGLVLITESGCEPLQRYPLKFTVV